MALLFRADMPTGSGTVISTFAIGNRFMFTGREYDAETGLYYYRARFYSPAIGRFLQADPVGYKDSYNLYQYCLNNPINYMDPDGKKVAWAVRDISGPMPVGNHHFILVIPDNPSDFPSKLVDLGNGNLGFTLDAGDIDGRLQYRFNDKNNIAAIKESFEKKQKWYKPDWDFEMKNVTTPSGMSDTQFINLLLTQANNYAANEKLTKVTYHLLGPNCSTWTNSMLAAAGISEQDRIKLSDFFGADIAERRLLDKKLFKSNKSGCNK